MEKMKRFKVWLLVLILALSLVACGGEKEPVDVEEVEIEEEQEAPEEDVEEPELEEEELVGESKESSLEEELEDYIPILDLNRESLIEKYGQPSLEEGYGGGTLLKFEDFSVIILQEDENPVHSLYINGNLSASGHDEIIVKYGHPEEEGFDLHDNVTYLLYRTEDHNVMFMDYGGENPYTKIWELEEEL